MSGRKLLDPNTYVSVPGYPETSLGNYNSLRNNPQERSSQIRDVPYYLTKVTRVNYFIMSTRKVRPSLRRLSLPSSIFTEIWVISYTELLQLIKKHGQQQEKNSLMFLSKCQRADFHETNACATTFHLFWSNNAYRRLYTRFLTIEAH